MVKLCGRGGGEGSHYVNPKAYAQIHNADAFDACYDVLEIEENEEI